MTPDSRAISAAAVGEIRITDEHTTQLVEAIRVARGDRTMTRTARNLIIERCAQLESTTITDRVDRAG